MSVASVLAAFAPRSMQARFLLNKVKVAHVNEGRIRVIYDDLKHDDELYVNVGDALDGMDEVTAWKINRITGSVTINYDPQKVVPGSLVDEILQGARLRV